MRFKFEYFLFIFVVLLSVSCVSAEDNVTLGNSLGDVSPTYYDVDDSSYSSYFSEDGSFNVVPGVGEVSVVRVGNLTNKNMVFNQPNLTITGLSDCMMVGGNIVINSGASGANVNHLTMVTLGTAITNYASDVSFVENNIAIINNASGAIYSVGASNVFILNNNIFINVTASQTYAFSVKAGEDGFSYNYNISGNLVQGINSAGFMLGIFDEGGLVNSFICDNNFQLIGPAVYCIVTNTNPVNENATGNLLISNNVIYVNGDLASGILNIKNSMVYDFFNNITVVSNGGLGISSVDLYDSIIYMNNINITGGSLVNEYPLIVPVVNTGIRIYGARNIVDNNIINGVNVDGISVNGVMNIVSYNTLQLSSNDAIAVDSQGLSQVVGISESQSTNNIIGNRILIDANATFGEGIYLNNGNEEIINYLIENNTIFVILNNIYGVGVNGVGLSSSIINHNSIFVQTMGYAFGVLSNALSNNRSQVLIITNNSIITSGGEVRGVELVNSDGNTVLNNNITASADSVYGVALGNVLYSVVDGNTIVTQAGNLDNVRTTDYIPSGQAAVRLYENNDNNRISNNVLEGLTNVNTTGSSGKYVIENNSDSVSVYILAYDTRIPLSGGNFTGNIFDVFMRPLVGHHVGITLTRVSSGASKTYDVVVDYQGIFTLPITLARGDYTVKVKYDGVTIGGVVYSPAETEILSLTVTDIEDNRTNTRINASNLIKYEGDDQNFIGSLLDADGNYIIGHHVSITLTRVSSGASKTYDVVSDFTGIFSLTINLGKGEYTAEISYAGTDKYKPSSTEKLTITIL